MAGRRQARKRTRKKPASSSSSKSRAGGSRRRQKGAAEYMAEAVSEWRKAARFAMAALAPTERIRGAAAGATANNGKRATKQKASLKEKLNRAKTEKGGRVGEGADALLAKLGPPGKLASKVGVGSRIVERLRPGSGDGSADPQTEGAELGANGNGRPPELRVPIQESIEIAVPLNAAYALAIDFDDYPSFLEHAESVEVLDKSTVSFETKLRGRRRTIEIEILHKTPQARIEWSCSKGPRHLGAISFHELAPRLTHIELSVELEPEDIVQKISRSAHLTERSIRAELQRFKAYAELWQDEEEIDVLPEAENANAADVDGEAADEEGVDVDDEPEASEDEDYEEEYEDEAEDEEEGDYEDESYADGDAPEAYTDEIPNPEHHEAYEEVAR